MHKIDSTHSHPLIMLYLDRFFTDFYLYLYFKCIVYNKFYTLGKFNRILSPLFSLCNINTNFAINCMDNCYAIFSAYCYFSPMLDPFIPHAPPFVLHGWNHTCRFGAIYFHRTYLDIYCIECY